MDKRNLLNIDEFYFVIDSTQLDKVKTKLYGNVISKRGIFTDAERHLLVESDFQDQDGTYVYVIKNDNKITIKQDYHAKYGLYLYKNGKDFYLSNSFYYLANYLTRKGLTFIMDKDYVRYMYVIGEANALHNQTMIKEIKSLPRACYIEIDIESKTFNIKGIEQKRRFIDLDSQEAIDIIDSWFYKWVHITQNLCNKAKYVTDELSGGIDSRLTHMLFRSSNINQENISFMSLENHDTDFEIASKIAQKFNFELNKRDYFIKSYLALGDTINKHVYSKLFFHNFNSSGFHFNPILTFYFDGFFGELLRGASYLIGMTKEKYDAILKQKCKSFSHDFFESVKKLNDQTFDWINKKFNPKDNRELFRYLYEETRARHHFGLVSTERLMGNHIGLSPLADKNLTYLKQYNENCNSALLLTCLLFTRFCPELLDIPFHGGSTKIDFTSEIRKEANRINKKYPLKSRKSIIDFNFIVPNTQYNNKYRMRSHVHNPISIVDYNDALNAIYQSNFVKDLISKDFGKDVYLFNKKPIDQHETVYSLLPLISYALLVMTKLAGKNKNYMPEDYYAIMLQLDKMNQ